MDGIWVLPFIGIRGFCKVFQLIDGRLPAGKGKEESKAAAENKPAARCAPEATEPDGEKEWEMLLTSQLVARYVKTGEEKYRTEFDRRLKLCGITDRPVMDALFEYNREIIARTKKEETLSRTEFVLASYMDLQNTVLSKPPEAYVEENLFTPSEVVKLFDEAEWHVANSHERDMPAGVWAEMFALSRLGGGKMMLCEAEKLKEMGIPFAQSQKLLRNDQEILCIYKWRYRNCRHPYPVRGQD